MENEIILLAHNLRSCNNVGSLLRTAEGLGIKKVYLTGYTPYPKLKNDKRLPYIRDRVDHKIVKTSLGAENYIDWAHREDIEDVIEELKKNKFKVVALEQTKKSINLNDYSSQNKIALLVGREVEGIEPEILNLVDHILSIPMLGKKESFNVVQAAAMALYKFRFN